MAIDLVDFLRRSNAGRDPERLAMKYRAMHGDAFAFLRGTCGLFYARLPQAGALPDSPLTWLCGDLHLQNYGSYRADNGLAYFDLNDFDEAVLAPAAWELVRLLASLSIGLQATGLAPDRVAALSAKLLEAYAQALARGKALWVERDTAGGLVRDLLDEVRSRKRPQFLDARTTLHAGERRLKVDGAKALPVTPADTQRVSALMKGFAATQADPGFFELLDVARRVAGTGSLGLERWLLLVRGKGSPDGNHLLDLKLAPPSSVLPALPATLRKRQPAWASEAHRVAGIQRRMQAVSVAFLEPVAMDGRPFVLRALQPSQDRVDMRRARAADLDELVTQLGRLTAWAQLRSGGREGSAIADELIAFGHDEAWRPGLLAAAQACAEQVRRDAAAYDAAFEKGAFAA